ncbi:putative sporulation protein YtaF [Clostridium tetanomorphum]|uniref:Sporulation membrane protein YtaF n=1 Tax=Clostridium tetanomorphum TaxID=1553 RepID=A0A923J1R3_CLOTT|nr:sporulation membrane protein YtaF [Clostridium tetanomorphum]KAJ51856.1 membrane spanning protein [Clostridium tetanomorphum DSM 665]MBC2399506.1 sporulation membrane protein YtaF [Clostridium tetanomorphum]MBP1864141.1 putative sporulation protein YtaF [Clostridium tetanomorphum]NRS84554.1 putative sporulation protein YtaF [Clostridium tetanomorphum]NRZ97768.1 putative sporulation protein YtaF [Clostridium tetanomorphum]
MCILPIIFFAISASSDSFIVGISYGINKIRIDFINNLFIATISGLGTFLSMAFGKLLLNIIPVEKANLIGSIVLILFGLYMLISSSKNKHNKDEASTKNIQQDKNYYYNVLNNPEIIDIDGSKNIELKESLSLGIVLSINNIGLGIAASVIGLNVYITSISSLLFGMIFIQLGHFVGEKFLSKRMSKYSEVISYFIIILLGLYGIFI